MSNEIKINLTTGNKITAKFSQGRKGAPGTDGAPGATGAKGDKGDTGAGVASGGVVGQYLHKKSVTDYDTDFKTVDSTEVAYGDGNVSEALGVRYTKTEADTLLGNKVDKVTGKSLVSDTAITDLTDGGDTTLHTHKSIVNEVSVDNAKVEALSTGAKITRNVADANVGLIINQHASSTGNIQEWQVGGVQRSGISSSGNFFGSGVYNRQSANNSWIDLGGNGTKISRNQADANTALIVNQANASSTGKILDLQFGGVSKASIASNGSLSALALTTSQGIDTGAGAIYNTSSANGKINLGDSTYGCLVNRNTADAVTALKVNQQNASSTGLITDFQFGGVSKASVDKDGIIKIGSKTPSSATDTGVAGTICWDANYIYVCTATNTWKRVAIATW